MSSSAPCDGGIVCWFNVSHFDLFNKKTQYYSSTPCDGGIACWFNVSHFDLLKKKNITLDENSYLDSETSPSAAII